MTVGLRSQFITIADANPGDQGATWGNLRSVIPAVWVCCRCQSGRLTWWWGQRWEAEDRSVEKTSPARRDQWGSRTSSATWSRRWLPLRGQGREKEQRHKVTSATLADPFTEYLGFFFFWIDFDNNNDERLYSTNIETSKNINSNHNITEQRMPCHLVWVSSY